MMLGSITNRQKPESRVWLSVVDALSPGVRLASTFIMTTRHATSRSMFSSGNCERRVNTTCQWLFIHAKQTVRRLRFCKLNTEDLMILGSCIVSAAVGHS